ncbi:MAG: DUF5683 domain-containing protein [Flavisolibacter sp.]
MTKGMLYKKIFGLFICCFFAIISVHAQTDSTATDSTIIDSTKKMIPVDSLPKVATPISDKNNVDSILKYHSPKKAAVRSAILPGLGQIYNKKYWKLPIIYGALGVSGAVFAFNLTQYRDLRFAYKAKTEAKASPPDSTNYFLIRPDLVNLDYNATRNYRDEYRRQIDYSALFFILLWGLNVVDAAVDAHLRSFDVSPDLSFKIKFGKSDLAQTTGMSLVLALKK